MFEAIFKSELANLGTEEVLAETLWTEIANSYSRKNRHYHNLNHLDFLIRELIQIKDELKDWGTVIFSVAYHDIHYNVLNKDNEEQSAKLAGERMRLLKLPEANILACSNQILATKAHILTADSDINYFTDSDLTILGSSPENYKQYTGQIRKEYKIFPDIIYIPGRKKVLRHFLQMDGIFKTKYFADKYESQARKNIETELYELGQ